MIKGNVKKLISINDYDALVSLIEEIKKGQTVSVYIQERTLFRDKVNLFTFESDKSGNKNYNAVSVIRDVLQMFDEKGCWTRNKVDQKITFINQP